MRLTICAATAVLLALAAPARAIAQTTTQSVDHRPLTTDLTAEIMDDLPLGGTVYSVLENTQAEVIADRFTSGGLNVGGDARLGGFLGSWSQTLFRIGDLDISDPFGSGAPMLSPVLVYWRQVSVANGLMPADINTPALGVTLQPRRGGDTWSAIFNGSGSGGSLAASAPGDRPAPIARLKDFTDGSALIAGPISSRLSLAAGGRAARGASFTREQRPSSDATTGSGFLHLVFTPSSTREWRLLGLAQRNEGPQERWTAFDSAAASSRTTALHLQTTFESHAPDTANWRVFAGFTGRDRGNDYPASVPVVERITIGPVMYAADSLADTTARRIAVGARLAPPTAPDAKHRLNYGVDLGSAMTEVSDPFTGQIREIVDTVPARIWTFSSGAGTSHRQTFTASIFASDTVRLTPSRTLDVGVRGELVHGSADDAATSVRWISLLPHASLRWDLSSRRALIFGYSRTANALNHSWLAYGDPGSSTATVATAAAPETIVSRVGPGTGGIVSFSAIDPGLKRPYTDEFVIGFEKRRSAATRYTLTGIARREGNLLGVLNTGVTASGYTVINMPDAGKDLVDPSDDRDLPVYNRLPSTFGQDAYLVTNTGQNAATAFALRMTWEHSGNRLFTLFGATASAATGSGANRGYGPLENDQDIPGELFTSPNAASYARGRLFADRAFTIKWTTRYRFPGDVTVAGIARYQDGQPFSRLVLATGLNQGAEAIQTYPNAGSRFTFTGTFDLRVQKAVRVGAARVDLILDAYNLLTRNNEVEEYVVSGTAFRTPTAIEPPHSIHLGARLTF
jgi:hypothetical protein